MDWELTAIKAGSTLAEALNKINDDGCQIALVIDEDKRLMGIIADSDIRKGMLKGVTLKDKVEKVMNKKPIVVGTELNGLDASKLMKMNKIFHLPVINESGIVKGLHLADQLRTNNKRKERIIIMAGGKGKRLLPLTETIPKPMLPIHSKPILEHILEKIRDEGFENITISINYLGDKIKEYFGDGDKFGVKIIYLEEKEPLGTAGILSKLEKLGEKEVILVTNGDVITDIKFRDMIDYAYTSECDGLMAVRKEEWQNPFAVVKSEGRKLINLIEKPIYSEQVNAGIYCLKKSMIRQLKPDQYYDMPDLFLKAIEENLSTEIYPTHEYWLDVGRPEDYKRASLRKLKG